MADPVSIALGIAPLALSVVKGLKVVRSRFKVLRSHDKVLRRLRRSFTIQSHVFLDECHLLLQQVVDPDDVVFMLEDDQSELWGDSSLDNKLSEHLGRKHGDVKEIIEEIHHQIKTLDERLNSTLQAAEREARLTAVEKVREAFDTMSNKAGYESDIDNLKALNQEFKRLRKMAKEIKSSQALAESRNQNRIPKEYRTRGEYARSFYNALRYCWSCTELQHSGHYMALRIDCEDCHNMDVFLHCNNGNNLSIKANPLNISVRPEHLPPRGSTDTIRRANSSSIIPSAPVPPQKRTRLEFEERPERPPSPPECPTDATFVRSPGVPTRNSLGTTDIRQHSAVSVPVTCAEELCEPINLRRTLNVCGALLGLEGSTSTSECFVDTPDSVRHVLALRSAAPRVDSKRTAMPLLNILERGLDADLSVTEQLRLVLQLTKGHLQLHWTPWWRQYWSLSDLSYFALPSGLATADLGDCLQTLHIGTQLDFEALHFDTSVLHLTPEVETALLTHGIRNLSLYCLGVALLQIGRWDPLVNATDDVVAVRKLAARNTRLGPRYQALTQKCIECDFGEGSDLGNPQLQGTIYKSVILELESLIKVLEET